LSGGEQQRIALARALLAKPDWIFLDEATASLDPDAEDDVYRVLKERLPNATLVSIAHRTSIVSFHEERMVFKRDEGRSGSLTVADAAPAIGE
ncbi:MAG TPA: ATP-binding cassette domain-containing protein, partial [Rhodopila sp.]